MMKKILCLLLSVFLFCIKVHAEWEQPPHVDVYGVFDENTQKVKVDVQISDYDNLGGIQFNLKYDPAVLKLDGSVTSAYQPFGNASFSNDPASGTIIYLWFFQTEGLQGKAQKLVSFTFDVTGIPEGKTAVKIEEPVFVSVDMDQQNVNSGISSIELQIVPKADTGTGPDLDRLETKTDDAKKPEVSEQQSSPAETASPEEPEVKIPEPAEEEKPADPEKPEETQPEAVPEDISPEIEMYEVMPVVEDDPAAAEITTEVQENEEAGSTKNSIPVIPAVLVVLAGIGILFVILKKKNEK